ncbi:MAG: enoyl-CoA hydratase/isomerase family protein [Thermomicrobiales bacterium]|nr:enoyl-CoA hydratase/isomerase family protein [Thermomicrobiales bacterium]
MAGFSENFTIERDGAKAILTFTREERLNALDAPTFHDLLAALTAIDADPDIGVLILTGRGKAFVAGADITGYIDRTITEYVEFQRLGRRVYDLIERLRQPVIAAVNGYALGGGFELVLAADLVVAAESAKLGLPEAKLGLLPGGGGTQRLPRLIGRNKAKELLMTADFISADEARELGIVNRVVPDGELPSAAHALADRILKRAPLAVQMAKQLVNDGLEASLPTAITLEMGMTATLYPTADAQEGIAAFIEKRPAQFRGR